MEKNDFYVEYLNRTGVLSRSFEEEGFFRAGVVWGLRITGNNEDIEKELTQLELFANEKSRIRSVSQNQEIVRDFLEKKYGKKNTIKVGNKKATKKKVESKTKKPTTKSKRKKPSTIKKKRTTTKSKRK